MAIKFKELTNSPFQYLIFAVPPSSKVIISLSKTKSPANSLLVYPSNKPVDNNLMFPLSIFNCFNCLAETLLNFTICCYFIFSTLANLLFQFVAFHKGLVSTLFSYNFKNK